MSFRLVCAALFATAITSGVALSASVAGAASSRDCKYYLKCDQYSQAYTGSFDNGAPAPSAQTQRPSGFQIKDESGLVGPHGVGW